MANYARSRFFTALVSCLAVAAVAVHSHDDIIININRPACQDSGRTGSTGRTGSSGGGTTVNRSYETEYSKGCSCPALEEKVELLTARLNKFGKMLASNRVSLCGGGMQDRSIKDRQITDSAHYQNLENHSSRMARLFSTAGAGAWCNDKSDEERWVQVDLEETKNVYGVVVQGRHSRGAWVTALRIQHKMFESSDFSYVQNATGNSNNFTANTDGDTPVVIDFPRAPIRMRFLRLEIASWNGEPSMRFDLLMC